jgi:chaperone modulatory protein CbpM
MTMETREFLTAVHIRIEVLDAWVESGWLTPLHDGKGSSFSEIDVARAQLIGDLRGMGVNDDAMPIILDLIDQMHGLRRTLRMLLSEAASAERAH